MRKEENMNISKTERVSNTEEYYKLHFAIINPLLPQQLSNKEIEILSSFLSQEKKLIEEEVFNPITRKKVMEAKGLSAGGLGNHLKSMIKKGFIRRKEVTEKLYIIPFVLPHESVQSYNFKLVLDGEK